jgi:AbiV family abortive infection protein
MAVTALTADELNSLAQLAFANAIALRDEARILFDNERWARAYALGVLAAEEYGKSRLCLAAIATTPAGPDEWKAFWRAWNRHEPKFGHWAAALVDRLSPDYRPAGHPWEQEWDVYEREAWEPVRAQMQDPDSKFVRAIIGSKMTGLYVDYVDGTPRSPCDEVQSYNAKNVLDFVSLVIDHEVQQREAEATAEAASPADSTT